MIRTCDNHQSQAALLQEASRLSVWLRRAQGEGEVGSEPWSHLARRGRVHEHRIRVSFCCSLEDRRRTHPMRVSSVRDFWHPFGIGKSFSWLRPPGLKQSGSNIYPFQRLHPCWHQLELLPFTITGWSPVKKNKQETGSLRLIDPDFYPQDCYHSLTPSCPKANLFCNLHNFLTVLRWPGQALHANQPTMNNLAIGRQTVQIFVYIYMCVWLCVCAHMPIVKNKNTYTYIYINIYKKYININLLLSQTFIKIRFGWHGALSCHRIMT